MSVLLTTYIPPIVIALLGLVLGSFASAMAYRVPRQRDWLLEEIGEAPDERLMRGFWRGLSVRSHCPACKTPLGVLDLVPLLSWLFLRGKCRHCTASVHWRYPVMEVATACICVLLYLHFGLSHTLIPLIVMVPFLMALFVIDVEYLILPNPLVLMIGVCGVAYAFAKAFVPDYTPQSLDILMDHALGGLVFVAAAYAMKLVFEFMLKQPALGLGDVKFFAAAGIWLGPDWILIYLMVSSILGMLIGLYWKFVYKTNLVPFGPGLILGLIACLLIRDIPMIGVWFVI